MQKASLLANIMNYLMAAFVVQQSLQNINNIISKNYEKINLLIIIKKFSSKINKKIN